MKKKKWMIIDGNSLINRTFYALPPLTNSKGIHTNAVYGFANILLKIIQEEKPEYLGVAFDERTPTFRHKDFTEYKAGRHRMPEELASQFSILFELLEATGIERISLEGYEADDLIGTLSKIGEAQDMEVAILTGDRDAFQLVSDQVSVWYTKKGISDIDKITPGEIMERYGVTPRELIDVKAFMGDKSDNIPGIPGVGEKTALGLIKEYKSLEGVYNNIEKMMKKSLKEKLISYREDAVLSKKLATIVRDIPLEMNIEDFRLENPLNEKLLSLFRELEFNSLLDRLETKDQQEGKKEEQRELDYEIIDDLKQLKLLVDRIKDKKHAYIYWVLEGSDHRHKKLRCLALGLKEDGLYLLDFDELDIGTLLPILKEVLEDHTIKKTAHNFKELLVFLYQHDIQLEGLDFDTYIAAYLLAPSENKYDLHLLASKYLDMSIPSEEEIFGRGKQKKSYEQLESKEKNTYIIQHLNTIIKIHDGLCGKLLELQMESLYYEIELPLIMVLAEMEYYGFHVEKNELQRLSVEFGERIDSLRDEIHTLAGQDFNINSPKQLGQILFEHLGLPIIKRTKTGYSTDIEVLERLKDKHPIIEKIIEIRQITKLKSTYVDGFMNIIDEQTGNIYSSFNQTITSTGRISSSEPNLQNIPIKMEMGRKIRKVFVPRNPENYLVDADYSQIELRILAHISGDHKLIEAFNSDQDIHQQTAAQVFDVDMEEVTPLMRGRAKAVNFGIVYGISDFGLSRDLNIPRKEAKQYIDNYKAKYSGVDQYMVDIVEKAKSQGYVTTIFGRRRFLPEIRSRNYNIRSFGERLALNTPIQGTAADIIKIAMINVHKRLKKEKLASKLILQVHDELIVEAASEELEKVQHIMIEEMEKAVQLKVKLRADIAYGKNWYHTK